jgi:hypothetical protein
VGLELLQLTRPILFAALCHWLWPLPALAAAESEQPQYEAEYGQQIAHKVGGHKFVWQFSCDGSDCRIGQFLGGDFWIAPKQTGEQVVLRSVSPAGEEHGLELNPAHASRQGFLSCQSQSYDRTRNLMKALPLEVKANSSFVKARKRDQKCGTKLTEGCCVDSYDVLTVLGTPPIDNGRNAFRPGFAGSNKVIYTLDQFDFTAIPAMKAISFKYRANFRAIHARWHAPYVDHYMAKIGDAGRAFAPMSSIPEYGAAQAEIYLYDLLRVMGSESLESKMPALTGLLQRGVDLYASWNHGITWPSGAGQQMGRKPPMTFFAALVKDERIKQEVMRMSEANRNDTQEDGQIRFIAKSAGGGGVPVWGDSGGQCNEDNYWSQLFGARRFAGTSGSPIGGGDNMRTCGDPYGWIDGPAGEPGGEYMACCSSGGFIAYSVAQNLMPELCRVANASKLNEYVRRIIRHGIHTQPDPCAPPDARESRDCHPYAKGTPGCLHYKKTWGPDPKNPGACIRDSNYGDQQRGRFPQYHGKAIENIFYEPEISKYLRTMLGARLFDKCGNSEG